MTIAGSSIHATARLVVLVAVYWAHAAAALEDDACRFPCVATGTYAIDVGGHLTLAAVASEDVGEEIGAAGSLPVGVAVGRDGRVHWAEYRTGAIGRAAPDGTRLDPLAILDGPLGLAFDASTDALHFTGDRHYPRVVGRLAQDGSPRPLFFGDDVNRPFAIAVAADAGRVFWSESINGRIRSAGVDGSDPRDIFDDGIASAGERDDARAMTPLGIAVDERRGWVFWSDVQTATVTRARFDGSERRTILSREHGLHFPTGLVVDPAAGKLYWADPGTESIGRADLNGLHPETFVASTAGVLEPYGLALDGERRLLYWSDLGRDAILRVRLDDGQVEPFVELAPPPAPAESIPGLCGAAVAGAGRDSLRRWKKSVRTCAIAVAAAHAVARRPHDLRSAAGLCARQLGQAVAAESELRTPLQTYCRESQVEDLMADQFAAAVESIVADLPRAPALLRKVRPLIAGHGPASSGESQAAIGMIDRILARVRTAAPRSEPALASGVPASGQTTPYAAFTRMQRGRAGVQDDGTLQAGAAPNFVDNGDGTISDRNTGLMWEKKCDGCGGLHDVDHRYPWQASEGRTDVAAWLRQLNAVDGTGFAGFDDWRLPETGELLNILDFENYNPAASEAFDAPMCGFDCGTVADRDCSCTRMGDYWSDDSGTESQDVRRVVAAHLGLVWGRRADSEAFVRAVRGPRPTREGRFVDNGDGTVSDQRTGLMWEKKCRCPESPHDVEHRVFWSYDGREETVWDWLATLNDEGDGGFAGYADWRLPTVKELYSLLDGRLAERAIAAAFAGPGCADLADPACSTTAADPYWTSTTFADFPALALVVGFGPPGPLARPAPEWVIRVQGGVEPHEKTLRMAVRAVRGPGKPVR